MTPEEIKDTYSKRIEAILQEVVKALTEKTTLVVGSPFDMGCDYYQWAVTAESPSEHTANTEANSTEAGTDITFTIAESEEWDGEENGVNFMLDVTSVGGEIIGGLTPYNYTPEVWVSRDDPDAIERRFQIMLNADTDSLVQMVIEHYAQRKGEDISRVEPCTRSR